MSKRQKLIDNYLDGEEALLFLEPEYFDDAIIGAAQRSDGLFVVAYSEPKIIELLIKNERMDPEEAMEWYQFKILGAFMGEETPVFIDDGILA